MHFELVAVRRHSHSFSVSPTTDTVLLEFAIGQVRLCFLESKFSDVPLYVAGIEALRGVYHVDIPVICYSLAEGMHATFMWFGLSLLRDV